MAFFRHFMEAIINPYFITLLLFGVSLAWLLIKGTSRSARVGLCISFGAFLLFSTSFLPRALTEYLENQFSPIIHADPKVQYVVVLGGGQGKQKDRLAHNLLTCASIKRLIEGIRLYRQLPQAKLILSGLGYRNEISEARRLKLLAVEFGIKDSELILEESSINTADEARELKSLLQGKAFYLVTSSVHMPRSMALFQKVGLNPIAAPTDPTNYWSDERWEKILLPNATNLAILQVTWHELLGRLWAKLQGKI